MHTLLKSSVSFTIELPGPSSTSSAGSSSSGGKENESPLANVISSLLQEIQRASVANGPSVALVDDLVAIVRKHGVKSVVKVENVARR
jgi:hypothetical protein